MGFPRFVPAAIAALVLTLGIIAAACGGGGDELSLEEYFQQMQAISDKGDEQMTVAQDEFQERWSATSTVEQRVEAVRDFFSAWDAVATETLDKMGDIDPPAEA